MVLVEVSGNVPRLRQRLGAVGTCGSPIWASRDIPQATLYHGMTLAL